MASDFGRLHELVERALDLAPEQRAEHLRDACGDDTALLEEAERLLVGAPGSTSAVGEVPAVTTPFAVGGAGAAARIGSYEIRRVVGSGGMGTVYEAEQRNPKRKVALKMVHADLATPSTIRRFRVEAEILAHLLHPNIAQVYEAGLHEEGVGALRKELPWFALEFVEGASTITSFALDRALDLDAILQLFEKVCSAVHHAHQRGVIHRDLKPGNVLVDASGEPKIIDFGVARATADEALRHSQLTTAGEIVGTVKYMPPEQIGGIPEQVDSRADVYALGVILYELLCGESPCPVDGLSLLAAAQVIREEPPRRPRELRPGLAPDLEWILLHALEKEPDRRYSSVSELAADLRRFRSHEPVSVGPPSTVYRVRKFARRNRVVVTASALLLLGLVGWALESHLLRVEAQAHAERAAYVNEVLRGALAFGEPYAFVEGGGVDLRLSDFLRAKAEEITEALEPYPEMAAELRLGIGGALAGLGDHERALPLLRAAIEEHRERLGPDHPETVNAVWMLAQSLRLSQRYDEAQAILLDLRERTEVAGLTDIRARVGVSLARALAGEGRYEEARAEAIDALARCEADPTIEAETKRRARWALGDALLEAGAAAEAERHLRAVLESYSEDERDLPFALVAAQRVGIAAWKCNRLEQALEILGDGVERCERVFGPDHEVTLHGRSILASVLFQLSRRPEGEDMLRDVIERRRARYGRNEETLAEESRLAAMLLLRGALDEAFSICEALLPLLEADPELAGYAHSTRYTLVEILYARRELARAREELDRVLEGDLDGHAMMDNQRPRLMELDARIVFAQTGDTSRYERFVEAAETELGSGHRITVDGRRKLANMLAGIGSYDEALDAYAALGAQAPEHPELAAEYAFADIDRALLLHALGRYEEEERFLRPSVARARDALGEHHVVHLRLLRQLGLVRYARGESSDSLALLAEALALVEQHLGTEDLLAIDLQNDLAVVHTSRGEFPEAALRLTRAGTAAIDAAGPEHPAALRAVQILEQAAALAPAGTAELEAACRGLLASLERRTGSTQAASGRRLTQLVEELRER